MSVIFILDSQSLAPIIVSVVIAIAGVSVANDAIQPAYFTSMFATRIRYSGVSLGREGGTIVGGGLAPIIATWLLSQTGHWWPVAAWMALTVGAGGRDHGGRGVLRAVCGVQARLHSGGGPGCGICRPLLC